MTHAWLGILTIILFLTGAASPPAKALVAEPETYDAAMRQAINEERARYGLEPLGAEDRLQAAGASWATELAEELDALRHRSPEALIDAGVGDWTLIGENLARFTPSANATHDVQDVLAAFMDSPAHRENVLCSCTDVDTAVADHGGTVYLVVTFIG